MTSTYSSLELEKQITKYSNDQETILTIGVFDGVHKGHQLLFEELNDIASKTTHHSTAITFTGGILLINKGKDSELNNHVEM